MKSQNKNSVETTLKLKAPKQKPGATKMNMLVSTDIQAINEYDRNECEKLFMENNLQKELGGGGGGYRRLVTR